MKPFSMSNLLSRLLVLGAAAAFLSVERAAADEGMWLFTRPPTKQLKEKYGFDADGKWLEHLQKSCVRISTGGSGSLVSPTGLVMTNHHVGSDILEKLSTAEDDLIERGFHAKTLAEEVPCPELEMNVLWSIEDVTDRVKNAAGADMSSSDANTARRKMMSTIEQESTETTKLKSEIVTLYQGGRYHLYRYKRYTDVRLVMAPEKGIAFFGGDPDNFEFPRYDLDMCFFRIYEDGKPLEPEHYLRWSRQGATDNELVFVAGHPGRTERLFTVDHLKFLRDVVYPMSMRNLWRAEVTYATFSGRSEENRRIVEGDYFGVQNSRKARSGIQAGLHDPELMSAKQAAETKLRAAVAANPEHAKQWGDGWDEVARAQKTYGQFYERYTALGGGGLGLGGTLATVAKDLVRLAAEKQKESPDRLREYRDSNMASLELGLYSPAPVYPELEKLKLASRFQLMIELLGGEDPTVVAVLAGKSPKVRAEEIVSQTKLADVATRKQIAAGGADAIAKSTDPLIVLVRTLDPESRTLRKRYEDEVESVERAGYAKIAAAKFALEGEDTYPDATFTLRLSYGTVKGYQDGGRTIAPFTNFAGLYARSEERGNQYPFELPKRWAAQRDMLNPNTPFNFVSTCDIIGGNSGSPVVNRAGEVVGLIFDGNSDSLVLDIAYDDEKARAVSVDSRSMIESLRKVYDANGLADELSGQDG